MSQTLAIVLLLFAGVLAILLWVVRVRPWLKQIREYINKVSQCGYLLPAPTPSPLAYRIGTFFLRWLVRVAVGRVFVYGRANMTFNGATMVVGNHGSYADPGLAWLVVNRPCRFMAAQQCFTFARGLGSLIFAPLGAFCCDLRPGKGGPAKDAAVKVLIEEKKLVLFPEGFAWMDGEFRETKKGAVRIIGEVAEALNEEAYLQPLYIRYHKYPGKWILGWPSAVQYFWVFLNFWLYRRGATIVVGKPIASSQLPKDDTAANALLWRTIYELDPEVNEPEGPRERLI